MPPPFLTERPGTCPGAGPWSRAADCGHRRLKCEVCHLRHLDEFLAIFLRRAGCLDALRRPSAPEGAASCATRTSCRVAARSPGHHVTPRRRSHGPLLLSLLCLGSGLYPASLASTPFGDVNLPLYSSADSPCNFMSLLEAMGPYKVCRRFDHSSTCQHAVSSGGSRDDRIAPKEATRPKNPRK